MNKVELYTHMKINIKSSFLRSIVTLTSGSIFAQLISLIVAPIMTRLYSANELGAYTLILTSVNIFGGIICSRYEMSIVTEPKEKNVYVLIKLSLIICLLLSVIISFVYWIYFEFFMENVNLQRYAVMFIFILLISTGVTNILIAYNNRNKEYKLMTSVYVIRTAVQNALIVFLGFLKFGIMGLLFSQTIGQLCGVSRQAKALKPHFNDILAVRKSELVKVLKKNYRQPLFSVPATFANSFSYSSINLIIEGLYGMEALGYYSISFRVLGLPLSVISANVAKVFFDEASREYNETGQFYRTFRKTTLFLTALAIPMVLAMIFLAPPLCAIIFGSDWVLAGQYIRVLAPMFGVRFIVSTLSLGLQIAKKQKYELALQIGFVVASIFSYIISKLMLWSIEAFLGSICVSYSIIYATFFVIIYKCAKNK